MPLPSKLSILGAGPAGLAAGYYAAQVAIPFTIYEANSRIGGNAVTFEVDGFRFDSGAHRFHDKDPQVTKDMKHLLGDELVHISIPSQIHYQGKMINFPLAPLDLLQKLGPLWNIRAGIDLIQARLRGKPDFDTFERFALYTYGRLLAGMFLLNYSEKLWGLPTNQLSPTISGSRLKNLTLRTLIRELLEGDESKKQQHLDGAFYYPKQGYGEIVNRLASTCGYDNIRTGSRITRLLVQGNRIAEVEINNNERVSVDEVVNTLPLPLVIRMLEPAAPSELIELASQLRFRNVILTAIFLDKTHVTRNGSTYFPDKEFIFTRVYEPNNRSAAMSPAGKTSLCAEIPCFPDDDVWKMSDEDILKLVQQELMQVGWFHSEEVLGGCVIRMPHAYPVLAAGLSDSLEKVFDYLQQFENLKTIGRNGQFQYTHVHDLIASGRQLIDGYQRSSGTVIREDTVQPAYET